MKKYEALDISGDVGLRIWGRKLEELFENAASGMSELITDVSKIIKEESRKVVINNDSYEDLLILWLNELIFLFDTYGFIGKHFTVTLKDNKELRAEISGGIFEPETNERRLLLKAATYHGLSLKKNGQWEATVIFDI